MGGVLRYARLLGAFARFSLATELAFRVNFLMKITVELLWLGILLIFYALIFGSTGEVGGWDGNRYLFFVGCYYLLEGTIETFFLSNCTEFSDLVRSGELDTYLLRPIDEQFLITCRSIDWSTAPKLVLGPFVMGVALWRLRYFPAPGADPWHFDATQAAAFVVLFGCSVAIAYSFLVMLTMSAVWLVRNQSLMEMWWLLTTLMRYPREIYARTWWAAPLYYGAWYLLPVLIIINVPASTMVRELDLKNAALAVVAAVVMLGASRWFFLRSLRSYRSASS
jgi:ABC-2 type transport system permease protein